MPAAKLHAFFKQAAERGVDVDSIIRDAGIDPFSIRQGDLVSDLVAHLLSLLADHVPDNLGIDMGVRWDFSDFGLLGYALLTCRTFGEFSDRWQNCSEGFGHPLRVRSVMLPDAWVFFMEPRLRLSPAALRMCLEETIGSFFPSGEALTSLRLQPVRIELVGSDPRRDAALERTLDTPVIPGAAANSMVLRQSDRSRPINVPHDDLLKLCDRYCDAILPELKAGDEREFHQVREALLLSRGRPPALAAVAATLGTSERSLCRRLAQSGRTYRDIVADYRRDYAMALLDTRALSVKDIAFTTGFSNPSSLRRAFRKWEGETISQWTRLSGRRRSGPAASCHAEAA